MAGSTDAVKSIEHLALIGNFLPRKCGLATYTTDTYTALKGRFPDLKIDVYAMDDHPGLYEYPPEVTLSIPEQDRLAYTSAARAIEGSGAQAIWLQHEYGIFGGPAGEHILALLDRVSIPVIVTLHTILEKPSADERRVMEGLLRRAAKVVVMAERGREILERVYGASSRAIVMIPHGVPDRDFIDPNILKPAFDWEGRKTILTFGLLAPSKGIETMIEALPEIVAAHPDVLYAVLGATHPNLVAHEGEAYRDRLKALAAERGVADHVAFIDAFLEHEELIDYLQAGGYLRHTLYQPRPDHLGHAFLRGRGRQGGRLDALCPRDGNSRRRARRPGRFRRQCRLCPRDQPSARRCERDRTKLSERAYARGRTMIWPRLAELAMREIAEMVSAKPRRLVGSSLSFAPLTPDFSAVARMSDSTGMLQHSIYSVPDRRHGYCIDDNARALILVSRMADIERGRARQVDDGLCVVPPICLEPGGRAVPQFHEFRPDLVRVNRLRGFQRPYALGAGRHGARCGFAQAS